MPKPNKDMEADEKVALADISARLKILESHTERIAQKLDDLDRRYVSNDAFEPVKKLAYGMAGVILLGVFGALLSMVVKK